MSNLASNQWSICGKGHPREYLQVVDGYSRRLDDGGKKFFPRVWLPNDADSKLVGCREGLYCNTCVNYLTSQGLPFDLLDVGLARSEIGSLFDQRPQPPGKSDLADLVKVVRSREDVVCSQHVDAVQPDVVELPQEFDGPIFEALRARHDGLYPSQVEALTAARSGKDVIQVTGTSSGKTVGLLYPALDAAVRGKNSLIVTPRNVLPTQYLGEFEQIAGETREICEGLFEFDINSTTVCVGLLNGDIPQKDRPQIKKRAQILITNEYMFEWELLAWDRGPKGKRKDLGWRRFMQDTSVVVFDELDCKLGHERSTTMWALRAAVAVIAELGSRPTVLMASATVSDPIHFHELFTGGGVPLAVIDGVSRRSSQDVVVLKPDVEQSVLDTTIDVVVQLAQTNAGQLPMSVVFVQSPGEAAYVRGQLEVKLKAAGLSDQASAISEYTGPTDASDRREIERGITRYQTRVTVATDALGVGADLGPLEVSIIAGCPQTAGKALQWMGRAGRRSDSLSVLVLDDSPLAHMVSVAAPFDALVAAARQSVLPVIDNHAEKFFLRALCGVLGYVPSDEVSKLPEEVASAFVSASGDYRLTDRGIESVEPVEKAESLFTSPEQFEAHLRDGRKFKLGLYEGASRFTRGAELMRDGRCYRVVEAVKGGPTGNGFVKPHVLQLIEIEEPSGWGFRPQYQVENKTSHSKWSRNSFSISEAYGRVRLSFLSSYSMPPALTIEDAGVAEIEFSKTSYSAPRLVRDIHQIAFELGIPTFDFDVQEIGDGRVLVFDKHPSGRMSWVITQAVTERFEGVDVVGEAA